LIKFLSCEDNSSIISKTSFASTPEEKVAIFDSTASTSRSIRLSASAFISAFASTSESTASPLLFSLICDR
jgi:hypothetical protein